MNYIDFLSELLQCRTSITAKGVSLEDTEVMITKSDGTTLITFLNNDEVVSYFKVE